MNPGKVKCKQTPTVIIKHNRKGFLINVIIYFRWLKIINREIRVMFIIHLLIKFIINDRVRHWDKMIIILIILIIKSKLTINLITNPCHHINKITLMLQWKQWIYA